MSRNYLTRIVLVDANRQALLVQELQPANGQAPTSTWEAGEVIRDFHSLSYHNLITKDVYHVELAVIDPETDQVLPVQPAGTESGDSLPLISWP